jgi:hypothetical protein
LLSAGNILRTPFMTQIGSSMRDSPSSWTTSDRQCHLTINKTGQIEIYIPLK